MPRNDPILRLHHVLEQQTFGNDELLDALVDTGRVKKHAPENLLYMPRDQALATAFGVSPHGGGPIGDYQDGIALQLEKLKLTRDGMDALSGNDQALDRMAGKVHRLGDTMTIGLVNGDLYTNTPLGANGDDIRKRTQYFNQNIDAYGHAHAGQIGALKSLSPLDRSYLTVTHSEGRIVTLLDYMHQSPHSLTKGGNADLQRTALGQAISNAHSSGRVTMSPGGIQVVENVLGAEAAASLRGPRGQQGVATLEMLVGDGSARTLVRQGGLLATGASAILTANRAKELAEQGNDTAAKSEVAHGIARGMGAWTGGAAMSMALGGTSGFLPAAAVMGEAVLVSKAFDKAVDHWDSHQIYNQTDRAGVNWKYDGKNWERQEAFATTRDDTESLKLAPGVKLTPVVADYETSMELSAKANATAIEYALAKAPKPRDPFDLPAAAGDQVGMDNPNWRRNPDTEAWERHSRLDARGINPSVDFPVETANAEQTRRLNQQSIERVEDNIANGREGLSQAYLEASAIQRARDYGVDVPSAVEYARAKPDRVQGSDGATYQQTHGGQWVGTHGPATGNMALELDVTQRLRQPSLERSQEQLAAIQALPSPSQEQRDRSDLLHRYQVAGINLNAQQHNMDAVELASKRTLAAAGVTGQTMQALKPDERGSYGYDSPIVHYQVSPNGVAREVAFTTSEELRQAKQELATPAQTPVTSLAGITVSGSGSPAEQEVASQNERGNQGPQLADTPEHPDHATYMRIHSWVSGTGNWDEEQSRNVSAALYKQQANDPLLKQVDHVTGSLGKDGAHNVFAVYAPYGMDKGPIFHAHVDGREVAQEPAQQNLQQAEDIKQSQERQQAQDLTRQQSEQQERGSRHKL